MHDLPWMTAREIAEAGLPDLPSSAQGVKLLAKAEGWAEATRVGGAPMARKRPGRGGATEYDPQLLPQLAFVALVQRHCRAKAAPSARAVDDQVKAQMWEEYMSLPEDKRVEAERRWRAVQAYRTLNRGGVPSHMAAGRVGEEYGAKPRTVHLWVSKTMKVPWGLEVTALVDRRGGQPGSAKECDPAAWNFFVSDYLRLAQPSRSESYERLQRAAASHGWTIPSLRVLERRLAAEIPKAVQILAREGDEALKRTFPPQRRDRTEFTAMQAVNADGHKFDNLVKWPGIEKPVRPVLLAIQDLYSNKIVGWRVGPTEDANLVRLAFRDCFERHGVPDHIYLDNGRGFASKWLTGQAPNRFRFKIKAEEPVGILTALGCEVHWTLPYSGQSKPIERAFRDLTGAISRHPALDAAYVGNSPANKPDAPREAVAYEAFMEVVRQGIEIYNSRSGRRTQVCQGEKSFAQAFQDSLNDIGTVVRTVSAAQLDRLMLAAEGVKARGTSGEIHLLGNRYWSQALIDHAGQPLTVRFDPDNLHSAVRVYSQDGRLIGTAELIADTGFADAEAAKRHARARRAVAKATKTLKDGLVLFSPEQVAALMPDLEPEEPIEAPARLVANLPDFELERPTDDYLSGGWGVIRRAAEARAAEGDD